MTGQMEAYAGVAGRERWSRVLLFAIWINVDRWRKERGKGKRIVAMVPCMKKGNGQ